MSIGFAFSSGTGGREHKFILTDESGKDIGFINFSGEVASPNDQEAVLRKEGSTFLVPQQGWATVFLPLGETAIVIEKPGIHYLRHVDSESSVVVGQLNFAVVDPVPLTEERIAAIKSDPSAMKAVRVELGCQHCSAKCRAYAGLERSDKAESEGWVWYQDVTDAFRCDCGKTTLGLEILRRNLHGLLGIRRGYDPLISFVPLYERGSLETLRSTFARLLESKPKEERLQTFLEENPILLHQFPSFSLFSKPPILTFFVADFALVTPKKELLLIELEKSTTKLMKKGGGVAAGLGHAFDQIRSWLHVVDEHRLAVLDSLKIEREDVSAVRGVVIAGRDVGYDAHHLRRLKGEDWGRVSFLTYDDLLFSLDALMRRMDQL